MKLIAICGMAGSGKTSVRKLITEIGYEHIKLGVTEMVINKHGEVTEDLEREARTQVRKELGMDAMAKIAIPKIDKYIAEGKTVVIDNMYSWSEYKTFKSKYKNIFVTIAVVASPETRYERLAMRTDDPRDLSDSDVTKSRDYNEIERLEKGGPIAMADYYIVNEGSDAELNEKVESIVNQIQTKSKEAI